MSLYVIIIDMLKTPYNTFGLLVPLLHTDQVTFQKSSHLIGSVTRKIF